MEDIRGYFRATTDAILLARRHGSVFYEFRNHGGAKHFWVAPRRERLFARISFRRLSPRISVDGPPPAMESIMYDIIVAAALHVRRVGEAFYPPACSTVRALSLCHSNHAELASVEKKLA